MVDSDMVAARCSTGTIQQARPMKTSVVARPMRMIASDGDGRLRKRAIAPTNTSTSAVMAATKRERHLPDLDTAEQTAAYDSAPFVCLASSSGQAVAQKSCLSPS